MVARLCLGEGVGGVQFMKFILTYDGELRSNGRPNELDPEHATAEAAS
jgi:hypothetical protein